MADDTLPCPVRLPSGVTFGKGVSLATFLAAAKRQSEKDFQDPSPPPSRLKRVRRTDFVRNVRRSGERAALEAQMIWKALSDADFDLVLREALQKLPHEVQLDMAQTLLTNLGMVAVRSEYFYADHDGEPRPWIEALLSYARDLGFVMIPSERVADIEAALKEKPCG